MIRFLSVSFLGHEEHEWDPNNPSDVEKIKKFFKEKLKAGFRAFVFTKDGKVKRITEFDENAERIVLTSEKVTFWQPSKGG